MNNEEQMYLRLKNEGYNEEQIEEIINELEKNTQNTFATFIAMYSIQEVLDWYKNGRIDKFTEEIYKENEPLVNKVLDTIDDNIKETCVSKGKNEEKVGYLTKKEVEKIIEERLKEYNYKKEYKEKFNYFIEDVKKAIIQGMVAGKNPKQIANKISEYSKRLANNGKTLMRTETSIIQTMSQKKQYEKTDVEYYEWVIEPDACSHCKAFKGEKLPVKDMEPGINAPAQHPNCRCSTMPILEGGQ